MKALAALAALSVLVLAGCGGTVIDVEKSEDTIQHELEEGLGKKIDRVDCPSEIPVEVGRTFECSVHFAGGKVEIATMKIRNDEADVNLEDLSPTK